MTKQACAIDRRLGMDIPDISVIMPVYNQVDHILEVLVGLDNSMSLPYELIVIDDASKDGTFQKIAEFCSSMESRRLTRFRLFRMKSSQFETKCDALGFAAASGKFLLEVQADMTIQDPGFDLRLVNGLRAFPDIIAIGGRGVELVMPISEEYGAGLGCVLASKTNVFRYMVQRTASVFPGLGLIGGRFTRQSNASLSDNTDVREQSICPELDEFARSGRAGRLGDSIEKPLPVGLWPSNKIWLSQTVMRGPLILDAAKYDEVGGFDVERFFLGYDDHEFALKAYIEKGYRTGYVPVNFHSPLSNGSTRKKRTLAGELDIFKRIMKLHSKRKQTYLSRIRNMSAVSLPKPEIREIPKSWTGTH